MCGGGKSLRKRQLAQVPRLKCKKGGFSTSLLFQEGAPLAGSTQNVLRSILGKSVVAASSIQTGATVFIPIFKLSIYLEMKSFGATRIKNWILATSYPQTRIFLQRTSLPPSLRPSRVSDVYAI